MKTGTTTPYHLMALYYNDREKEVSGRVCAVNPKSITVIYNFDSVDEWRKNNKDLPVAKRAPFPETYHAALDLSTVVDDFTDSPVFPQKTLAFLRERGIITVVSNAAKDGWKPENKVAEKQVPYAERATSQGASSKFPEEENIMAKTAVFDSDSKLIKVYDSGKAAKAAHKGQTDVIFIVAGKFPEAGIGDFKTESDLFPAKVEPEKAEGAAATRTVIKREGTYHVLKTDGLRCPEGDERLAIHKALMENTNFDDFFKAAPEKASYTSTRGAEQSVTASAWVGYAVKRGWIGLGEKPAAAASEAPAEPQAEGEEAPAEPQAEAEA